jgi:hypothetical protein
MAFGPLNVNEIAGLPPVSSVAAAPTPEGGMAAGR